MSLARRKPINELTSESGKSEGRLNKFLQEVDPARIALLKEEYGEPGEFSRWIRNNHACQLSRLSSPEKMARIQWFEEPASYRGLDWKANTICTDLIVFGSSTVVEVPKDDFPPTFDDLDIHWEFGLQSIHLGVSAEGRVVQPLHGPYLNDEEQVNFLGFKEYSINDFIKCLQGVQVAENNLEIKKSGYIIEEQPWKEMWEESKRLDSFSHRLRPISDFSPFRYKIFISYSHDHAFDIAKGVFGKLKDEGFEETEIFFDEKDLPAGSYLNKKLADGVGGSQAFVILLNKDWADRSQSQEVHQIDEARKKNKEKIRVIPVYLEEMDTCFPLNDLTAMKFERAMDKTKICTEIARAIKKSLSE
jgi:hypothetical protein